MYKFRLTSLITVNGFIESLSYVDKEAIIKLWEQRSRSCNQSNLSGIFGSD